MAFVGLDVARWVNAKLDIGDSLAQNWVAIVPNLALPRKYLQLLGGC